MFRALRNPRERLCLVLREGQNAGEVALEISREIVALGRQDDPKPFTWTKSVGKIIDKLSRLNASVH